jgi:hypothetical protein
VFDLLFCHSLRALQLAEKVALESFSSGHDFSRAVQPATL